MEDESSIPVTGQTEEDPGWRPVELRRDLVLFEGGTQIESFAPLSQTRLDSLRTVKLISGREYRALRKTQSRGE